MFLRANLRNKEGKDHTYWSLVETVRTPDGPRQRTLCYLGELNYNSGVRGDYVGPKPARRRLYWGLATVCVGSVLIAWDFHRDLLFIWGYILGVKLVLSGGTVAIQGALMLRDLRRVESPPPGAE